METGTFSNLSQDVLDRIVDCGLDASGKICEASYFSSCALVCRSLRPRSQKILYGHIHVFSSKRISDLITLVQRNPLLASYIRKVCSGWEQIVELRGLSPDLELLFLNITRYYPRSSHILSISADGTTSDTDEEDETALTDHADLGMISQSLSTITRLEATNIVSLPTSMLLNLPQLRQLLLKDVTFDTAFDPTRTFTLQLSSFFFRYVEYINLVDMNNFPRILIFCCQELKWLSIENVTFSEDWQIQASPRPQINTLNINNINLETTKTLLDFLVDIRCLKTFQDTTHWTCYQWYTLEQSVEHTLWMQYILTVSHYSLKVLWMFFSVLFNFALHSVISH